MMAGSKVFVVVLLSLVIVAESARKTRQIVTDHQGVQCPPSFQNLQGRFCYKHFSSISSWTDAWTFCKSINTELLTIDNAAENQAVSHMIDILSFPDKRIWLGVNNMLGEWSLGRFGWQPLSYTSWAPNEPSTSTSPYDGGIQCLVSERGQWRVSRCGDSLGFVCRFESDGMTGP